MDTDGRTRALTKKNVQPLEKVGPSSSNGSQVDPLICDCGGSLRVIGFITEHKVIRKFFTIWISETATLALLLTTNRRFCHSLVPRRRHAAPLVRLLDST